MTELAFAFIEPLRAHPNRRALEALVRAVALDATLARRADFASRHRMGSSGPAVGPGHIPEGLTRVDAETQYGNVLDVLERGVERPEERALLGALFALSLEDEPPEDADAAALMGFHLVWLATNTPCNGLAMIDATLGADADAIWRGVARVLTNPEMTPADFGPTEALVAAAALRRSLSPEAQALRFEALGLVYDDALYALLAPTPGDFSDALSGEVQPAPRRPMVTVLLTITGMLFLIGLGRLIARHAFLYRRPAALRLGPQGLELSQRIQLMGQDLREQVTVIPLTNIARITREVMYQRLGLYVGLAALTLGTYFGTGLFVDGVRVPGGSAPLLGLAALFILVGLGADFVLNAGADAARGRCRIVLVPRKGRALCVGGLDPMQADALLQAFAKQTRDLDPLKHPAEAPAPAPAVDARAEVPADEQRREPLASEEDASRTSVDSAPPALAEHAVTPDPPRASQSEEDAPPERAPHAGEKNASDAQT